MSRQLVIVSNRVALPSAQATAGGLAVALADALAEDGGVWFGWSGKVVEQLARRPQTYSRNGVRYVTADLTERDHEEFYLGFSNSVIWPSFHFRLDLAIFERDFFRGYRRVNGTFADKLTEKLKGDEDIWVHDYQMIPMGAELRDRGCQQRIGFFLHIPFPPPQILQALPGHEWLVRSLFAYDLIGFQTHADRKNFTRYVREELGGQVNGDTVKLKDRTVIARTFPIGIDVDVFQAMADSQETKKATQRMRQRNRNNTQIIGAERLDYSKGLPHRFRAFQSLLEGLEDESEEERRKHGRISYMQIATPTREGVDAYDDLRHELEQLSGQINGRFGQFDWTPLRYLHRAVPRATLAGIFRESRVALVTPLRDGMNLVAKEYVVVQNPENPGVLVLSRFAGAAESLAEALIVNPYDEEQMADKLHQAILMPLEERKERHAALLEKVQKHDIVAWRREFLSALRAI